MASVLLLIQCVRNARAILSTFLYLEVCFKDILVDLNLKISVLFYLGRLFRNRTTYISVHC